MPSKVRDSQLVEIQSEERLAATPRLNPAYSLVTGGDEARVMRYRDATQVKGFRLEINGKIVQMTPWMTNPLIASSARWWL